MVSATKRLVPAPKVVSREIENGAVLVDMGSGQCFELNRVGLEIWQAIGRGATVQDIYETMADLYPGDRERLMADLATLADALVAAGLAEIVESERNSTR